MNILWDLIIFNFQ